MRNKIRLLQGEASAGLAGATAGALPEEAPQDGLDGSQTGQREEEDQSASQRRKIRFCASLDAARHMTATVLTRINGKHSAPSSD